MGYTGLDVSVVRQTTWTDGFAIGTNVIFIWSVYHWSPDLPPPQDLPLTRLPSVHPSSEEHLSKIKKKKTLYTVSRVMYKSYKFFIKILQFVSIKLVPPSSRHHVDSLTRFETVHVNIQKTDETELKVGVSVPSEVG